MSLHDPSAFNLELQRRIGRLFEAKIADRATGQTNEVLYDALIELHADQIRLREEIAALILGIGS